MIRSVVGVRSHLQRITPLKQKALSVLLTAFQRANAQKLLTPPLLPRIKSHKNMVRFWCLVFSRE